MKTIKTITISLTVVFSVLAVAAVEDFNNLINENESIQSDLHNSIQDNVNAINMKNEKHKKVVLQEEESDTVVVPTKKIVSTSDKFSKKRVSGKSHFKQMVKELKEAQKETLTD